MVGETLEMIVEGHSIEHEYLLAARPLLWAPDIDGTVLINDSEIKGLEFGKIYQVLVTELLDNQLIGKIRSTPNT